MSGFDGIDTPNGHTAATSGGLPRVLSCAGRARTRAFAHRILARSRAVAPMESGCRANVAFPVFGGARGLRGHGGGRDRREGRGWQAGSGLGVHRQDGRQGRRRKEEIPVSKDFPRSTPPLIEVETRRTAVHGEAVGRADACWLPTGYPRPRKLVGMTLRQRSGSSR